MDDPTVDTVFVKRCSALFPATAGPYLLLLQLPCQLPTVESFGTYTIENLHLEDIIGYI